MWRLIYIVSYFYLGDLFGVYKSTIIPLDGTALIRSGEGKDFSFDVVVSHCCTARLKP